MAFAGASILFSFHAVLTALLRARLRFASAGISVACGRWLTALLSTQALGAVGDGRALTLLAVALLAGEALTFVIAGMTVYFQARSRRPVPTRTENLSLREAMPFAANGILAMAYNRFDVLVLSGLSTAAQLSFYAPASRIQDALYLIPSAIGMIALPLMSTANLAEVQKLIRRLSLVGLSLAFPVALGVFLLAPQIIHVVLGTRYGGAVGPTRILVWFLPLAVIQAPLLAALIATGRGLDTTKVIAGTFATAMAMHFALDWWMGATGAAIASLSRDPVAVLLALYLSRKAGLIGSARVETRLIHGAATIDRASNVAGRVG
jgi:O-antigen/teichoic acid export membrane protein